jgi:hypothetical protein
MSFHTSPRGPAIQHQETDLIVYLLYFENQEFLTFETLPLHKDSGINTTMTWAEVSLALLQAAIDHQLLPLFELDGTVIFFISEIMLDLRIWCTTTIRFYIGISCSLCCACRFVGEKVCTATTWFGDIYTAKGIQVTMAYSSCQYWNLHPFMHIWSQEFELSYSKARSFCVTIHFNSFLLDLCYSIGPKQEIC